MTIDEAITLLKFNNKHIADLKNDDLQQIAEWLEELKANRIALEKANGYLEANYRLGYNKAIDDFVILMKETLNHDWATTKISEQIIYNRLFDKCNEIAEQLKAGMENDT